MFGLGTGGDLYTIDVSHTVRDVNNDVGYDVTQIPPVSALKTLLA
jgi:hypothetical protein